MKCRCKEWWKSGIEVRKNHDENGDLNKAHGAGHGTRPPTVRVYVQELHIGAIAPSIVQTVNHGTSGYFTRSCGTNAAWLRWVKTSAKERVKWTYKHLAKRGAKVKHSEMGKWTS